VLCFSTVIKHYNSQQINRIRYSYMLHHTLFSDIQQMGLKVPIVRVDHNVYDVYAEYSFSTTSVYHQNRFTYRVLLIDLFH